MPISTLHYHFALLPQVSALVLNYRNPESAVQCVRGLLSQSVAGSMEVIVIDNHSQDDSVGVLRNRLDAEPSVRIVETPENRGFGYGLNVGARSAWGEYLLINTPDKRLPADGVERLLAALRDDPGCGIIAPKLLHADGTRRLSIRAFPRMIDILSRRSVLRKLFPGSQRRYLMLDADPEKPSEVDWVVGGCFLIRKDLFESLRGFDERFFLFFEDTDLCRRVRAAGKSVRYYPAVAATDKRNRLSGERFLDLLLKRTGRIHVMSAAKYFWKWKGSAG